MAFSFPYPVLASRPRPVGQGCKHCVHRNYCMAVYWYRRYGWEGRTIDEHMGIQCASWSNNPDDQIKTEPTEDDLNEEDYMAIQMIGSEPDRCGITVSMDGSNRKP